MAVSLNNAVNEGKVTDKSKPYGYEITQTVKPGESLPKYEDILLTDAEIKDGIDKTQYTDVISKVHNLKDAIETLHASEVYDLAKVANNLAAAKVPATATEAEKPAVYFYTWGDKGWQETKVPSDEGAAAQNGIAATGLIFGISMAASIFTTVGVSVAIAKAKKGGNK